MPNPYLNILVVDDDLLLLESLKAQLLRFGEDQLHVILSDNETESLELINSHVLRFSTIDGLICDYNLISGSAHSIILHFQIAFPKAPICLLTGMAANHAALDAFKGRENISIVHKPWSIADIQSFLKRIKS